MKSVRNHELVDDIINACTGTIGRESAANGIRALCRTFGGQSLLIPQHKMDGQCAEKILSVLEDEIGGADARTVFGKLVAFYSGTLQYIPLERCGFRRDIAVEIYATLNNGSTAADFCRKYTISNTQVYRLWRVGQRLHIDEVSPRLGFDRD